MAYLLHIETAVEGASICLSLNDAVIGFSAHDEPKESAGWIQTGIQQLMERNNLDLHQLAAVSVSNGPGSYTGLRVGLSTAKGLCYALNIPLLAIGTLKMMAHASLHVQADFICPMIDARRMEVYTALFNKSLLEIQPVHNKILDEDAFSDVLSNHTIAFVGNGITKFMSQINNANAVFHQQSYNAKHLVPVAFSAFVKGEFANLAYAEPCYGKAFYTPTPKIKM